MLINTGKLLNHGRRNGYALGGFNIYNLEGALAVTRAAEELNSPVILQLLPSAVGIGGSGLIAMCLELAKKSTVPVSVHLDHCSSGTTIDSVMQAGLTSIMADGSALEYDANLQFTRGIVQKATQVGGMVEAELGKLTGEEDGETVADWEEQLTDPAQAADFVEQTGISALAVCIGNIHGTYHRPPELDFPRLAAIAKRITIPLVLHGSSGLPDEMIKEAISYGVCKFNVNTEIRTAYIDRLARCFANSSRVELVQLMEESIEAMKDAVQTKLHLFNSVNKTKLSQ